MILVIRSTVWVTHGTDFSVKTCYQGGGECCRSRVSAKCCSRTHFWCYNDVQWDLVTPLCDSGPWFTISTDNGHVSGFSAAQRALGGERHLRENGHVGIFRVKIPVLSPLS